MLWCSTQQQQQQQQHDEIIKIWHRNKCMTDLSSCSTPNDTIHKVTIDIYIKLYRMYSCIPFPSAFGIYMFSLCPGISLYLPII